MLLQEDAQLFNKALKHLLIKKVLTRCFYLPVSRKEKFLEEFNKKLQELSTTINNDNIDEKLKEYAIAINSITSNIKKDDNLAKEYWINTHNFNEMLNEDEKTDGKNKLNEKVDILIREAKHNILQLQQSIDIVVKSNALELASSANLEVAQVTISNFRSNLLNVNNQIKSLSDDAFKQYTTLCLKYINETVEQKFEAILAVKAVNHLHQEINITTTIRDIYDNILSYIDSKLDNTKHKELIQHLAKWHYQAQDCILAYQQKAVHTLKQLGVPEENILDNHPIIANNFFDYQEEVKMLAEDSNSYL